MILVDSSVWIDYFRGVPSPEADRLDSLLGRELLVTGDLIVAEVLQGFQSETEFNKAKRLMTGNFTVVSLVGPENAVQAARNWGSKPKPQKFPSSQIKVSHERVQVDHLAIALEGVMPVEQDVPPSCR